MCDYYANSTIVVDEMYQDHHGIRNSDLNGEGIPSNPAFTRNHRDGFTGYSEVMKHEVGEPSREEQRGMIPPWLRPKQLLFIIPLTSPFIRVAMPP